MEVFKSLEILIGVSGVMLLLSLLVTALTQIAVEAFGLRSVHLEHGVAELLQHLGWSRLSAKKAEIAARLVLKGAASISREQLVENILHAAGHNQAHAEDMHPQLRTMLGADPLLSIEDAHHRAAQIAVERPELPAAAVKSIALTRSPAAGLAAAVFAAFDGVIAQVSQKFTASSRLLVCGFALVVAVSLPLDTFDLFRRFSTSDDARKAAITMAEAVDAGHVPEQSIVVLPHTLREWSERWAQVNILGVLSSVLLLSMGAPFWFGLLKDLLRLRSAAAGAETGKEFLEGPPAGGEKGDLNALGRMRE